MGPPRAEMPGVVPIERVVAKTDEVAIYLSGFWIYSTGFEVQVRVLTRDEECELEPFSFEHDEYASRECEIHPGKLRIGFEFADGSKVTNTGGDYSDEWVQEPWPTSPKMCSTKGRGGDPFYNGAITASGLWVWPLPPEGGLVFVCEWPAAEIPLTRVELDAASLLEASRRAQAAFS
jgi:hypothetical protein